MASACLSAHAEVALFYSKGSLTVLWEHSPVCAMLFHVARRPAALSLRSPTIMATFASVVSTGYSPAASATVASDRLMGVRYSCADACSKLEVESDSLMVPSKDSNELTPSKEAVIQLLELYSST